MSTKPDSKNKNPAAIHITRNPQTKNEKVLKIYATSASTSALTLELINIKIDINKKKLIFLLNMNTPYKISQNMPHIESCVTFHA